MDAYGVAAGMAPERRWNPSISKSTDRPDDSKKKSGAYSWSQALSVRLAIGGGQAATWEQGSCGAYEGFTRLSKEIEAQWSAHSQNGALLPLVKQVGVETIKLSAGNANVPLLSIVKWVPRPDCLKADAPVIATEPASAYVAPAPQAANMVPEDVAF